MDKGRNISSFSVLLLMAAAAVMGLACFPKLKLQYTPSVATKEITVSYSYPGASARIVEGQVTSKLEGVLSTIRSCAGISSHSDENGGYIKLETSRRANLEAVRFEVASLIRNAYPKLPEGCSYPSISLNTKGEKPQTAIAYRISGTLPSQEIASFVEREMLYPLSTIEGVNGVGFYGQTPFEWVITFDADRAAALGITANQLKFAISSFYEERIVGMTQKEGRVYSVRLHSVGADTDMDRDHLAAIPVGLVNDRVIHLGDLASFSCRRKACKL